MPKIVSENNTVYKAKKKEILLNDYVGGENLHLKSPAPETKIGEYIFARNVPLVDIDEDNHSRKHYGKN